MSPKARRPTHPGELLRKETLPAARLSQSELAARLGVSRRTVNALVHERCSVNPALADRLAREFHTSSEFWLRFQEAVDVWTDS
jgi:antitoxin HigA-1